MISGETRSNESTFRKDTQALVNNYLEQFPNEQARQQSLLTMLENEELDLRLRTTIPEGHICSSGILLLPIGPDFQEFGVLMLHHRSLNTWVVPGGHYDIPDGAIFNAALRETREETGLPETIPLTLHPWHIAHNNIPIDIDTHPIPENPKKGEGAHQHFDFRYILTTPEPGRVIECLQLDTNEVLDFDLKTLQEIDPQTSIAPAVKKLGLLALI